MYKFYTYMNLPKKIADRVKGQVYINKKNKFVKWTGKNLRPVCECGKARPHYNYEGETTAICCASCQKPGMVDVIHKKCECGQRPNYNYPDKTAGICCTSCKESGMVDVKHKKCQCGKARPHYNYEGETTAICCASCQKPGMVDVISKKCMQCNDVRVKNEKYDGYCLRCFIYLFPDKPVVRNYKTKEFAVVEYIKTYFPNVDWIADKTVNGCRNGKRPDLLLDLGYQVIIVEIDEDQHNSSKYDCSCENKRIMELSQDVGHRPIVFIRFNPDKYEIRDGTKITSCWGTDGFGICVVKKDKKKEWQERLNCLKNTIDYWVIPENKTNKTIETIELFYDEE